MKKTTLTIATRESPLALWQAQWVKSQLEKIHSHLSIQLLGLTTSADKMLDIPLYKTGGKGLFVKELEEALLSGKADIAVHSMKDVPMELPPDLMISTICERTEVRDVWVSNEYLTVKDLPVDALIGTSSLRRQSQLHALYPHLKTSFLRGNINTRLAKLDRGEYAAVILAGAGLQRLNMASRIRAYFSTEELLPAAGQGALGIECRRQDEALQHLLRPLQHEATYRCVIAERALCRRLGAGCHVPVAAYAELQGNQLVLQGRVASVDGKILLRACLTDSLEAPEKLGIAVAEELLRQGAEAILNTLNSHE